MDNYVTGGMIKSLREKKKQTQKELAELLSVTDKTVSKWETGKGLPDITLLEPLAKALGVSVVELLSGEPRTNKNRAGNLLRSCFYVCPICGNIIHSTGQGAFSCCGITLPVLEGEPAGEGHDLHWEPVENEWYVTMDHSMSKTHHISFLALLTGDRLYLQKLYPEMECAARFPQWRMGTFFAYCNHHGLYYKKL